jgi:nitroreductase
VETWDAIRARRNVSVYQGRPIAPDDLDRILEAGRRSPGPTESAVGFSAETPGFEPGRELNTL